MIQWSLVILLTAFAFFTDIRYRIIPNWLTVSSVLAGMIFHIITNGTDGFIFSICGLFLGLFMLFLMYVVGALGAGDVKLFAAFGAIAGMEFVMNSLVYALIYAGIIGCIILITQKKLISRMFWVLHIVFSLIIMKEWKVFQSLPQKQLLRFPFMWAVLPAVITYGLSMKGFI
jgi:prepilin peptidase CpaA